MAAHIVRCSYLVCRRAGGNVNPQHGKRRSALVSHINNIVRLSVGHGTRGTDTVQVSLTHAAIWSLLMSSATSHRAFTDTLYLNNLDKISHTIILWGDQISTCLLSVPHFTSRPYHEGQRLGTEGHRSCDNVMMKMITHHPGMC